MLQITGQIAVRYSDYDFLSKSKNFGLFLK